MFKWLKKKGLHNKKEEVIEKKDPIFTYSVRLKEGNVQKVEAQMFTVEENRCLFFYSGDGCACNAPLHSFFNSDEWVSVRLRQRLN